MYYTTETPKKCQRQARRSYTYEQSDFHFARRTPKAWGVVRFAQERRKQFVVEVVLSVLFAVAVAALVTLK